VQSTGQGKIKGKFGYMAPEQIQGHATRQSDIFATSVVLWEVLTGMRLFPGDDPRQVLAKILSGEITKPRKLAPHLPVGVDEIVMRGLERDAARRYATAREMALDLEACLGLASPSQVGSWVEASARTELAKRAAAMAEIEHSSSQVVDVATLTRFAEGGSPASGVSLLPSDGRRPGDDSLDASQSETVHHGSVPLMFDPARRRARIRKRVVLGAAVIAVVAGASAFAISALHSTAGSGIEKSESSAMIQPASGTSPIIPPLESTPSPAAALPPHTESDLSARYAPESSTSSHATNTAPRPPPPSTRRSPTLDCDPPYSLDEQGHKHWKDACFRK
jgi:serine/threonine-protein kinase